MRGLVLLTGAWLLVSATAHAQETRTITFAEAVEIASARATDVLVAQQGVIAAEEHAASTRGLLLPSVNAQGNVFVWSGPEDVTLGDPSMLPEGAPVPTLRVRNQITGSLTLTVAEPLTGLYAIAKLMSIDQRGIEAAKADQMKAQLDAASRAGEAFIRTLQAISQKEITAKSLSQVEAQLERARVLERAGSLQAVDVLRIESLLQQTKQGLLKAEVGTTIAARGLGLALNTRDRDVTYAPKDDLPPTPPPLTVQAAEAIASALSGRPEITAANKRAEAAANGRAVAMAAWIPEIAAVGTYQRNEGSAFQAPNSLFGGLTMRWNVWDWGRTWNAADEADARAEQARLGAEATVDQVAFDAERRVLDARASYETIAAAKAGLAAAEEAHRIQSVRYAQGEATTTDVLDAETDLARARTTAVNARYEYYLSLIALSRAVGEMPEVGGGKK